MFDYALAALVSLFVSVVVGFFAVKLLKKFRLSQPISGYVTEHEEKNGTPTMGGVIFVIPALAVFLATKKGSGLLSYASIGIYISFALIGFFDDFIKIKFRRNEGLTPVQKVTFQLIAAVIAAVFICRTGLTEQFIPFSRQKVDLGWWMLPISVFVIIATTNCVNLTDGLDGLAATNSVIYLLFSAAIIFLQLSLLPRDATAESEYGNLILLCAVCAFSIMGFLLYNTNTATVFMGDTGSLSLGALVGFIGIVSGNVFYIPFLGVTFVTSGVSVIIQVLHYKRTKKRVFLMAPLHHHFQHKGYNESKIVYAYKLLSVAFSLAVLLVYL